MPQGCPDLGSWDVRSPLLLELSPFSKPHLSVDQVNGSSAYRETAGLDLRASQSLRELVLHPKKPKGSWRFALP